MRNHKPLHLVAVAAIALSAAISPSTAVAGSTIYVAGSGNEFGTLDLTTGDFRYIGTLSLSGGGNTYGMGFGSNGNLYGLDSSLPNTNLYRIDTSNANTSLVGTLDQSAIDGTGGAAGKMYALSQDVNSVFYTLKPPSTTTIVVGPTGITSTGLLAVNASGTQIFAGAQDPNSGTTDLYSINPTTGAATLVGDTGFFIDNGLFVKGTLYGFDFVTDAIVAMNITTGVGTQVATVNTLGNPGLGTPSNPSLGDTILASAVSIPEPSSVILMGLGVTGALGYAWRRRARKNRPYP